MSRGGARAKIFVFFSCDVRHGALLWHAECFSLGVHGTATRRSMPMPDGAIGAGGVMQPTRITWPGYVPIYTIDQILDLPPADWTIDGVLQAGSFGVLYGPSGEGKSFIALDMALSIATGRSWQAHAVQPGPVIYIVGEGGLGIAKRVKAWMQYHGVQTTEHARFTLSPIQITQEVSREALIVDIKKAVGSSSPALIVLDTLARCFVGGDEDRSKDMGEFVEAVSAVQRATGASVLVVHHTLKKKNEKHIERGSTALRGAADFMMLVRRAKDGVIKLQITKQKDHEEAADMFVRLNPMDLECRGVATTSCVVVGAHASEGVEAPQLKPNDVKALTALPPLPSIVRATAWMEASGLGSSTFNRCRSKLLELQYVEQKANGYVLTSRGVDEQNARAARLTPTPNAASVNFLPDGEAGALTPTTSTPLM
jgi:hypothetical protein